MRPCLLDDLLDLEHLSDPQSSPDGSRAAVVRTRRDADEDRDASVIELVDLTSGERRVLTLGPADRSPRWSPDGRALAFLRQGDEPAQVFLLPLAGGEPTQLTDLPLGVTAVSWSPDGTRLAVLAPSLPEGTAPTDPVVVTRLVSKADGAGRLGPATVQVFVVPVDGAAPTQVTEGDVLVRDLAWAPDGERLALVTALHDSRDVDAVSHVFVVPAAGGELCQVTQWSGSAGTVTWTPDGATIVLAGSTDPLRAGHTRLWRVPATGGVPVELAPDLDRNVMVGGPGYPGARPHVAADGTVRFCLRDRGAVHLAETSLEPGPARVLVGGAVTVSGASYDVVLVSHARSTADVHVLADGALRLVTRTNEDFFAEVEFAQPIEREFQAPDGLAVHGWLTGASGGGPQPLLLDIHGGPHNAFGPSFDPVHAYQQLLVAQGWVILTLNPRGSDGYGEDFWRAAIGAWGTADRDDFLSAVDALVADGIADPDRLAVTGYSYGGYMTCWLTTQTDRFAAAVPGGVVTDLISFCGTSDVAGLFDRSEFGATAVEDPELLRSLSPVTFVDRVTTPTLILHGAGDDRCPVGQAEQWFTSLRTLGRTVEMVLYPEASHLFVFNGRPSHRADWNTRVTDWVVAHTAS